MKVKICGLNPTRDVQICIDLKVNYLGFVFYEKSPRNVKLQDIERLLNYDKKNSSFVAVTVNPTDEFIKKNLRGNFEFIQLHGSETKDRVSQIKNMGFKVIKAIKVKGERDINAYKEFDNADIILFDTPGMEKSIEFPKELINKIPKGEKYALAGSVSKDNIENISKLGVNFFDLSSSLEGLLGYKDHHKIESFVNKFNELKN
jgi:phosphoribosylanthranilate isomerase